MARLTDWISAGAASVEIGGDGSLVLRTAAGEVRHRRPRVVEDTPAGPRGIAGAFVRLDAATFAFALGARDASARLVIDPVIDFVSYAGGSSNEDTGRVGVDVQGNGYVMTPGYSDVRPPQGGEAKNWAEGDLWVGKVLADGSAWAMRRTSALPGARSWPAASRPRPQARP